MGEPGFDAMAGVVGQGQRDGAGGRDGAVGGEARADSGQFLAIQHAAAYCFDHPEITAQIAAKYSRRMDGLVTVLRGAGFQATKPKGSFFLYVPAPTSARKPDGTTLPFRNAEEVSQWLITDRLISTVPWDEAGAYLRFSVTFAAVHSVFPSR